MRTLFSFALFIHRDGLPSPAGYCSQKFEVQQWQENLPMFIGIYMILYTLK